MVLAKGTRTVVLGGTVLISIAGALWAFSSYQEYQRRAALRDRKGPFAQVVALGVADGEELLRRKGLLAPSDVPRVACGLDVEACGKGLVRKFSIHDDGAVMIELSGQRRSALEGKTVVLVPHVGNGVATWKCKTDAPAELVPTVEDKVSGLLLVQCSFGET